MAVSLSRMDHRKNKKNLNQLSTKLHLFLEKIHHMTIWFIWLIVLICLIISKFVCFFFFTSKKMTDPIFKNRAELKKEYYFMIKEVLPSLNDCGYCGKIKCIYSKKFSVLTNYFLKMNITDEVKRKNPINIIQIYDEKKIEPIVKKEKQIKNFFYCKSKKHRQYFKSK